MCNTGEHSLDIFECLSRASPILLVLLYHAHATCTMHMLPAVSMYFRSISGAH